jgi:hypothetical protein
MVRRAAFGHRKVEGCVETRSATVHRTDQEIDMSTQKIRSGITYTLSVISMLVVPLVVAAPTFPTGKYKAGEISIQFDGHGNVKVSQGDRVLVDGQYIADGDQIKLTDESGPMACSKGEETGTYRWKHEGGTLTFSKVEDRCDGRSGDLVGRGWKREG